MRPTGDFACLTIVLRKTALHVLQPPSNDRQLQTFVTANMVLALFVQVGRRRNATLTPPGRHLFSCCCLLFVLILFSMRMRNPTLLCCTFAQLSVLVSLTIWKYRSRKKAQRELWMHEILTSLLVVATGDSVFMWRTLMNITVCVEVLPEGGRGQMILHICWCAADT